MSAASKVEKLTSLHVRAPLRLMVSLGTGLLIGGLAGLLLRGVPWELRFLCGWLGFAITYLVFAWQVIWRVDADWIRQLAQEEDNGKHLSGAIVLVAALVSLVGVVLALSKAKAFKDQALLEGLLIGGGVLCVSLSWLLIQTVYLFRYAHLFYESPEGGVEFPGTPEPDYLDFAYFAFTMGMTYQVSDTSIDQQGIRRLAINHGLLSYVYGVVIIALAISVTSSLLS
ncbi:DUF1345 domain-containing protein [Deinococcus sp.]|uniref:DUF1345 domain-containing protein n=1 Tax=Deinococcus sp. TaxID=47478 RepID=UPI0025EE8115|nr:DUF1345 domain-containing protein [Deinococcus sp.]